MPWHVFYDDSITLLLEKAPCRVPTGGLPGTPDFTPKPLKSKIWGALKITSFWEHFGPRFWTTKRSLIGTLFYLEFKETLGFLGFRGFWYKFGVRPGVPPGLGPVIPGPGAFPEPSSLGLPRAPHGVQISSDWLPNDASMAPKCCPNASSHKNSIRNSEYPGSAAQAARPLQ